MLIKATKIGRKIDFEIQNSIEYVGYIEKSNVVAIFKKNNLDPLFRLTRKMRFPFKFYGSLKLIETSEIQEIKISSIFFKPVITWKDYELIPHIGNKSSLFKSGTQIALIIENSLQSHKFNYSIIADHDSNIADLIVFFSLLFCYIEQDTTPTIHFGRFIIQKKELDKKWKPKELRIMS